jgi:hypothetical protein
MAAKNDITGDSIQTKVTSKAYSDGWDKIFGNKEDSLPDVEVLEKIVKKELDKMEKFENESKK